MTRRGRIPETKAERDKQRWLRDILPVLEAHPHGISAKGISEAIRNKPNKQRRMGTGYKGWDPNATTIANLCKRFGVHKVHAYPDYYILDKANIKDKSMREEAILKIVREHPGLKSGEVAVKVATDSWKPDAKQAGISCGKMAKKGLLERMGQPPRWYIPEAEPAQDLTPVPLPTRVEFTPILPRTVPEVLKETAPTNGNLTIGRNNGLMSKDEMWAFFNYFGDESIPLEAKRQYVAQVQVLLKLAGSGE